MRKEMMLKMPRPKRSRFIWQKDKFTTCVPKVPWVEAEREAPESPAWVPGPALGAGI